MLVYWDEMSFNERFAALKQWPRKYKFYLMTHPNKFKNLLFKGKKEQGDECTWNALVSECGQGMWCYNKKCVSQYSKDQECLGVGEMTRNQTKEMRNALPEYKKKLIKERSNCVYKPMTGKYYNTNKSIPSGIRYIREKIKKAEQKAYEKREEERKKRERRGHFGGSNSTRRKKRRRRRKSTKKKRRRRRKRTRRRK